MMRRTSGLLRCARPHGAAARLAGLRPAGQRRPLSSYQPGFFAGLAEGAEFTNALDFQKTAGAMPVFRILDENAEVVPGAELPFTLEEALGMYKTMVRTAVVDHIMNALQRQGRTSFYMTGSGEEAAQVGTIAALAPQDAVWPQYRELGAFLHRGFTIQQVVDQCLSRGCEDGKGRQMPVHYVAADLNLQAVTSPLATQVPQAAGAGYAFRVGREDRCGVAYFGDGAASEGDFAVALNFAATLKAQTIFLCRNNGIAISTPAREQYVGDGIAARGIAYGLYSIRVDGNDLAAVFQATKKARELCVGEMDVGEGQPVLVEMMTYRRGHHSTSDDATRYRGTGEAKAMAGHGLEPLSRIRLLLEREGLWDKDQDDALRATTREEVMSSLSAAEAKKFAPLKDMFSDVWATEPPQLRRQREELMRHVANHPAAYAERLEMFEKS